MNTEFKLIEQRTCDHCGKKMDEGYVIDDGTEYYCSNECLHKHYTPAKYSVMFDNERAYWTQWNEE